MAITQYKIDVFADTVFKGDQAETCATEESPADATIQNIASENNFSETASFIDSIPATNAFSPKTDEEIRHSKVNSLIEKQD